VDLDAVLTADFLLNEEVVHALTLVTLKLDNLAEFRISNDMSIAAEVLRKGTII
jgi:hypothetical protein